jgi:hypothetical protein
MCSDAANMTRTKKSTILTEGGQLHRGVASLFMNRFSPSKVLWNRNSLHYKILFFLMVPKRCSIRPRKTAKIVMLQYSQAGSSEIG